MARSATDLALELDVLAGPDAWAEGVGYRLALPPSRHDRLADFRILVIDDHPLCPTAASVTGAVNDLAERLGKLGCIILRSSAAMPNLAHTTRLYVELLAAAFISRDLPPEVRQRLAREAAALSADDDSLRACRLRGILMPHNSWVMATRTRFGITARWRALFRDIEAILCPAMPTPAFPHDHSPMDERLLDVDGTANTRCRPGRVGDDRDPQRAAGDDLADRPQPRGIADRRTAYRRLSRRPDDDRSRRHDRARTRLCVHAAAGLLRNWQRHARTIQAASPRAARLSQRAS